MTFAKYAETSDLKVARVTGDVLNGSLSPTF